MIRFFVAGIPKAMSVGRSVSFKRGGAMHHFQQRRNNEWALLVGQIGREHAPTVPYQGPVALHATFYLPRPKSAKKSELHPTKRPDIDNLIHKLTDQFNGVFWADDSQVVVLDARKHFASAMERTGVLIEVSPILAMAQSELRQPTTT